MELRKNVSTIDKRSLLAGQHYNLFFRCVGDLNLLSGNLLCIPGTGREAACLKDAEATGSIRRCRCRMEWAWCAFFLCGLVILLAGALADSASKMLEEVEVRAELRILAWWSHMVTWWSEISNTLTGCVCCSVCELC